MKFALPSRRHLGATALASLMLVAALPGCGQEATIESGDADVALAALDGFELAYADGRCDVAQQRAQSFGNRIDDLSSNTDRDLRLALRRSADHLSKLANSQCEAEPETVEPTEPVTEVEPPGREKPDKEKEQKEKEKDKGQDDGGDQPPVDEGPPEEESPPSDDGSGGVGPGEDGVLE